MNYEDLKASALFDVEGLVTIVTGGAAGLGRAFVEVLATNGAAVTIFDRDSSQIDATVGELRSAGLTVSACAVDVTDRSALKKAIDDVAEKMGRIDVVFANAGISAGPGFIGKDGERDEAGAIEAVPDELWDKVLATNLTSVFSTIKSSAPHMKRQNWGRIIVTSSIAGLRPSFVVGTPYQISKAGSAHLVKQAAAELAKYGVTVNAIMPGPFLTSLTTPELEKAFARSSPIHRAGNLKEIQGLVLYLASRASSYVTGTHIVIDGGALLGRPD